MSNKAKWRNYTKQELAKIVKESKSNRDVARALGYSANGGGTMQSLNRMYKQLNLDTSQDVYLRQLKFLYSKRLR